MPHTDVTPTSASVISTGPSLFQSIGNRNYQALSGSISVDNTETVLLEFTSPNTNLKAYVEFFYLAASSADYIYKVYLGNILILGISSQSSGINRQPDAVILIPSNTHVKMTAQNVEDSSSIGQSTVLVARELGYE